MELPRAWEAVPTMCICWLAFRATHRLADVLRELKSVSSGWVHDEIGLPEFAWQEGYGAFTVTASQREAVRRYIE
jgi:hypothetical protein